MRDIFKVTFVIIGTVIGAGFASGQEISIFFSKYGIIGILGMLISCFFTGIIIYFVLKIIKSKNVNTYSVFCILLIMLFVLRSYTLPILLISVIEFAIFTNMSIPYFNGTILPFVAPIVIGTIQLGATIDYAILMTTTYLKNRKDNIDKETSINIALTNSIPSIIVSGLCFFGATFGVGIYSQLEMVGSLCALISRGAIISMLFVILILPSALQILKS